MQFFFQSYAFQGVSPSRNDGTLSVVLASRRLLGAVSIGRFQRGQERAKL